jgi:3-oxoacyl-[acyl-carrier-protein] synthase-3
MPRNAIVIGSGTYVPKTFRDKEYFINKFGENVSKFFELTHIGGKYVCAENESSLDLAVEASKKAIESAGIKPEEIDLILLSTDTPAFLSPCTSVAVQYLIGAKNAGTFDINCACAGYVTAMITAYNYIKTDAKINTVLVIGAYAMSKYVKDGDPAIEPMLGDGAGALILRATESDTRGIKATKLVAQGQYYDYLGIYGGGSAFPPSHEMIDSGEQYVQSKKKFPATVNIDMWPGMIKDVLKEAGEKIEDVNWTVLTQVNYYAIAEVHKILGIPEEKAVTIMEKYGYTGSGCIPMAVDDAIKAGKFKENDLLVLVASGGGANFAALTMRW